MAREERKGGYSEGGRNGGEPDWKNKGEERGVYKMWTMLRDGL